MIKKLNAKLIRDGLVQKLTGRKLLHEFMFYKNGTIADVLDVTDESIIGYEIKSDVDTYLRLPKQIEGYNSVCDKIYVVVGESKATTVAAYIPDYYGIIVASSIDDTDLVEFNVLREALSNSNWSIEWLLYWLPSSRLKIFAKTKDALLAKYDYKKTRVNKLTKALLLIEIMTYFTDDEILTEVNCYLRSEELQTKREDLAQLNKKIIANKNNVDIEVDEINRRVGNYEYIKEDLDLINDHARFGRLRSLSQNYLPLCLEYNRKGIHIGRFIYNDNDSIVELEIMGVDELVLPLTDELILILKYCLIDNWSKDCLLKRLLTLNGDNKKDND